MSGIYIGRWDCSSCGNTSIAGDLDVCPGCGRPRPQDVAFYLPEDAQAVTDAAGIREARAGADWYCQHCGSANPNDRQAACEQCAAPRGSSPQHQVREYTLDGAPRTAEEAAPRRPQPPPPPRAPRWSTPKRLALGAGVLSLLLICLLGVLGLALVFGPRDTPVTVTALSWERAVAVERHQQLTEEGWSIPEGGSQVSQRQEIRRYDEVFSHNETRTKTVSYKEKVGSERYVCGKRDLGNGRFEDKHCNRDKYETKYRTETYQEAVYRDVPVYDTKYTYTIWRWREVRTERLREANAPPRWPEPALGAEERLGQRQETYTVLFTDKKGKQYTHEVAQSEWQTFAVGQQRTVRTNALGTILRVNS